MRFLANGRELLRQTATLINHDFLPQNEIYLKLLNIRIPISKAISKGIYADRKSRVSTTPTAQRRYTHFLVNVL